MHRHCALAHHRTHEILALTEEINGQRAELSVPSAHRRKRPRSTDYIKELPQQTPYAQKLHEAYRFRLLPCLRGAELLTSGMITTHVAKRPRRHANLKHLRDVPSQRDDRRVIGGNTDSARRSDQQTKAG